MADPKTYGWDKNGNRYEKPRRMSRAENKELETRTASSNYKQGKGGYGRHGHTGAAGTPQKDDPGGRKGATSRKALVRQNSEEYQIGKMMADSRRVARDKGKK